MKGKLGNYIATAFIINVFAIMSVGGVCILMVRDMVNNISHLEEESSNVAGIFTLNSQMQKAIYTIHDAIVRNDPQKQTAVSEIFEKVERDIQSYRYDSEHEQNSHSLEEILLLDKVHDNLVGIKKILEEIYADFSVEGTIDSSAYKKIENYGFNIQKLSHSINDVHFKTVSLLVNESYNKMYFILLLYLASSVVGILASCVGYVVLTRHTIRPIIDLASATEKISTGDLGIRVETASETEIGTLYHSFNIMTEKLQVHERKRESFNKLLEGMVKERTKELRESEKSLRRTQAELIRMEKIATLGQIATTVNHEIKTPLNVLYMNLQLLIRKINKCNITENKLKHGMLEITDIINNEITRINGIIEEFVKFARFPPPEIKINDINKILTNIAGIINQNARESDVKIEVKVDDGLQPFPLDEKKIIQALLNLAMNALQAMPYGGELRLESKKEGNVAKILIQDSGKGIAADDLDKIFDPFFTKKEGGLGFGLAIVQRIIEDHHGEITCSSEIDKGTEFEIFLPMNTTKPI